ncbi:MAG: hypothetical protein POELPBGB_03101 [Bacteroidia bacterium]|nr:hypothetical protein [Bacteroidia bacterium]
MSVLKSRDLVLYSFFLALVFLFYRGYTFNSWDQAECLPQVYQLLDSSLYATDFFMQEYQTVFTVRFYFVYFIYGLSCIFSVPAVCFVLTVVSLFLSIFYLIKITQHFTDSLLALLLSPLFAFFVFFNFTVGGNQIQSNSMIPGTLAAVFAIAAIHFCLEQKYNLSFLLLGLGTLFQPLVTLQVFLILVPVMFLRIKYIGLTKIAIAIGVYLFSAAPMLLPVLYRQFFFHADYDSELYYQVLYRFRNHLHYLPSLFPVGHYVKLFVLVIAALAAIRFTEIRNKKVLYFFSAVIISGMLVYWILLEKAGVPAIGKLQWFKTTVWLNAMACIALAVFIGNLLEPYLKIAWKKILFPVSAVGSLALFIVLYNSKYIPVEKLQTRYQIGNYKKSDLTLLHEWMEHNLPKDAVILCSPENTSLSCEAKRSQAVQYQAIIHEPFYMLPWYKRFEEIYGVNIEAMNTTQDMRKLADGLYQTLNFKGNTYKIDYRIDNKTTCTYVSELGKTFYQSGDWVLTEYLPE